jgi:hypothetical protein
MNREEEENAVVKYCKLQSQELGGRGGGGEHDKSQLVQPVLVPETHSWASLKRRRIGNSCNEKCDTNLIGLGSRHWYICIWRNCWQEQRISYQQSKSVSTEFEFLFTNLNFVVILNKQVFSRHVPNGRKIRSLYYIAYSKAVSQNGLFHTKLRLYQKFPIENRE